MQKHADFLGALGLIPFLVSPLLVLAQQLSFYEAQGWFTLYSGVILSFLGGVHWYDAQQRSQSVSQLYLAMLPSIIAWLVLAFGHGIWSLVTLATAFGLVLIYDFIKLEMPPAYQRLRIVLTGVVIGCHCVMIWLSV